MNDNVEILAVVAAEDAMFEAARILEEALVVAHALRSPERRARVKRVTNGLIEAMTAYEKADQALAAKQALRRAADEGFKAGFDRGVQEGPRPPGWLAEQASKAAPRV